MWHKLLYKNEVIPQKMLFRDCIMAKAAKLNALQLP